MSFTKRQSKIIGYLEERDPKISDTFKGGIEVLKSNYSEKIAQSAHSLREVVYLLTRLAEIRKLGRIRTMSNKKTRKQDLIENLDPTKGAPEDAYVLYDDLVKNKLKWFSSVAHHSEFPDERKFRAKVDDFEILLEKILKPHFEVIDEINELLKIKKPSGQDFDELKNLISRNTSAYRYFFQNASPIWLPYLLKSNYLKSPLPTIEVDGQKKHALWPPAAYLWKCASEKPGEVSKIILSFEIPKKMDKCNPWLLEYFVKSAIEMPPRYGKLIAEKIYREKWIETSYPHYLDMPISELMRKLADAGLEKPVQSLACTLLNVKLGEPYVTAGIMEDYEQIRDVKPVIDHYRYVEILKKEVPYIFDRFPKSTTVSLVDLVTKTIYLENVGREDKKSKADTSVGWRPAIEDHEQNRDRGFRSQLLGTLANLLIRLGQKSIPTLRQIMRDLSKRKYPAFRRIELHVYRTFPKTFKKEIDLAVQKYFDIYELHHEYFHLLQSTFGQASENSRRKYLSFVERGPDKRRIECWKLQERQHGDNLVDLKIRLWKADKLKPILKHLSNREKGEFGDLVDEKRGFPHPDFRAYSSVGTGQPETELKDDLTPDQVFGLITNYKAKELDFEVRDGTPEKFQNHVRNNSEEYSKLALKCANLDSVFIFRFFTGIEKAAEQKNTIVWECVLSLCEKIIGAIKENKFSGNKTATLSSMISALGDGIEFDSIDFSFRDRVWSLLIDFVILAETDPSWEEGYPRENWDSFSISINTIDGKTFHAIMKYAIWCESHLNKKRLFVLEVKETLSHYMEQKIPASVSKQAVLGYHLTTLYYYDKKWIKSKLSDVFKNKSENLSRGAWDAYLVGWIYGDVYEDLEEFYAKHVKKLNSPPLKDGELWAYDERVINHITLAHLFKFKNSEKIFYDMIDHGHEKVLAHCAWHIGCILKEQKEKPNKSFDTGAFKKLWKNSRMTSNEELRMWVEFSPFNEKNTLELLYNSLRKSTKSIRFLSLLVGSLEPHAKSQAQLTLKCLDLLVRKRINDPEFHIARERLRAVLQILLQNQKTQKKTRSLVNYLGEFGYNEYGDLVTSEKQTDQKHFKNN